MVQITSEIARRLAISCQHLDGWHPPAGKDGMLSVLQGLRCVQLDPINVVARSPLLVLWSRLGAYEVADLEALLWDNKSLFEYWAHAASIVLTEDFPLHQPRMSRFACGDKRWEKRVRDWMEVNESLQRSILRQLSLRGPLLVEEIEVPSDVEPWQSSGWSEARSVTVMLTFLWERGEIMVTRRLGNGFGLKKQWGLMEEHLPQWSDHEEWPEQRVVYEAVQKSLRALGVGTAAHIKNHFIRGRYPGLAQILGELENDGLITQVHVVNGGDRLPRKWYVHQDVLPLLDRVSSETWESRTTLLSPFDNLICDRARTEALFGFEYRSEIYTPKKKRQYGYYVMPILHGDRLVGRLDPRLDRKRKRLTINALYWEPTVTLSDALAASVEQAIESLAAFLGAADIEYL